VSFEAAILLSLVSDKDLIFFWILGKSVDFTGKKEEIIDGNVGRVGESPDAMNGEISVGIGILRHCYFALYVKPVCLVS